MNSQRPLNVDNLFDVLCKPRSLMARLIWGGAACGLLTLLVWPLRDVLDPSNIAMLYLLIVVLVSMCAGKLAAIIAALLSTASLDFFFIHPRLSFTVGDVQYGITLVVMLLVALIIANLTISLQRQASAAIERERQSQALYQLARQLSGATTLEQVAAATRDFLQQAQQCRSTLLMRRNDVLHPFDPLYPLNTELQSAAAFAAMQQAQIRHLQDADRYFLFLPLHGST
jgi:two-component system sensor histidine kinase KdpD